MYTWHPNEQISTYPPDHHWWTTNDGEIITSTNVDYLPYPPSDEHPTIRRDGHFGHHELCRWPQFLVPPALHRAWIPRLGDAHSDLGGDPLTYRLSHSHFSPSRRDGWKARCPRTLLTQLTRQVTDTLRSAEYCIQRARHRDATPTAIYHALELAIDALRSRELSFREMVELIAEVQRHTLELKGFIRYRHDVETKWRPNVPFQASSVQDCRGAFVGNAYYAHVLTILGIPCWALRGRIESFGELDLPSRSFKIIYPHNVLELGEWTPDSLFHTPPRISPLLSDLSPPSQTPAAPETSHETRRPESSSRRSRSPTSSASSRPRSPPRFSAHPDRSK
jgi:hypothetical protein